MPIKVPGVGTAEGRPAFTTPQVREAVSVVAVVAKEKKVPAVASRW